jgi:hypothetical protein
MKVAIVRDWLTDMNSAEKFLKLIINLDVAAFFESRTVSFIGVNKSVITSLIQRLVRARCP